MGTINDSRTYIGPASGLELARMLNDLIEKINIISRQKSINAICTLASQHIVQIFDFDYAVISLFDFKKRKIVSKKERSYANPQKDLGLTHPYKWIKESDYHETEGDILLQVLHKKRNVKVIGRHVLDNTTENARDHIGFSSINRSIFENYEHEKLARLYMPIIYRGLKEGNNSVDLPLGVIEIGIKEDFEGEFSISDEIEAFRHFGERMMKKYPNEELLEKLLQLYTDNFAVPCYTATVNEESEKLLEQLRLLREEKNNYSGLSYEAFATDVIKKITTFLQADWGVIALKTFNNNYINYFDKGTYFSDPSIRDCLNEEVFNDKEGALTKKSILVHVCEETFETYYSDDITEKGGKYINGVLFPQPVRSEMITPIYYENEIVGVVDLYSTKKAFFNPLTVSLVEKSMRLFMGSYMMKKRQHVYNRLIKPTETWNHPEEAYHQLVRLLTDYYYTDSVCLWIRDTTNNRDNEYILGKGFPENQAFVDSMSSSMPGRKIVSDGLKERLGPEINLHYDFSKDNSISRFCAENDFIFYLSISVKIVNRYELFINIFSKQNIFLNSNNREKTKDIFLSRDYEFLSQISMKMSISLQNLRIMEAFKDMAASGGPEKVDHSQKILEKIVQSAQIATGADIVAIFPFYPEKMEIRKKDGILSNGFTDVREERAVFADIICNMAPGAEHMIHSFDSNQECKDFLLQKTPNVDLSEFDEGGFRARNNIKSTCAVKLEFGSEALGVIFFNYKEPQHLRNNSNLRQIVLFFSTFSAYQLYLNRELNSIKKLNAELDEKYKITQLEVDRMIPLITRTQFYLIVEGVSHIMKNALEGIEDDLADINYLNGRDKHHFEKKKRNILNSLELIESVLTIFNFRDKQNQKVYVSIKQIVDATIKFFRIRHGDIEYRSYVDDGLPAFRCHKAEFAMVIYNLIYNSIAAIEAVERKEGFIDIGATLSPDGQEYVITVEDNGIGIKHEMDDRIYLPNVSTKDKGTGLGLYYIKQTIEGYNGSITHRSIYREYTKFTLKIPLTYNYID